MLLFPGPGATGKPLRSAIDEGYRTPFISRAVIQQFRRHTHVWAVTTSTLQQACLSNAWQMDPFNRFPLIRHIWNRSSYASTSRCHAMSCHAMLQPPEIWKLQVSDDPSDSIGCRLSLAMTNVFLSHVLLLIKRRRACIRNYILPWEKNRDCSRDPQPHVRDFASSAFGKAFAP